MGKKRPERYPRQCLEVRDIGLDGCLRHLGAGVVTPRDMAAARQLCNALESYRRRVEADGGAVASPLLFWESMARFCVMSGQDGATFGDLAGQVDAARVSPRLLTYDAAAAALMVSTSKVKRLVKSGALPHVKVDGCARIRLTDLDSYVEQLGQPDGRRLASV